MEENKKVPAYHKEIFEGLEENKNLNVFLRGMTPADLELIMAWRNIPQVYNGFYTQDGPLVWESHLKFWTSRENWKTWIIQVNDGDWTRDVGYIAVGQTDSWYPDIGILIGEITLQSKGIGKKALEIVIGWLKDNGYTRARASILETNIASLRLFESCGFTFADDARPGELLYDLKIT